MPLRRPSLPVLVGLGIGAFTSLQTFILGRVGERIESVELASAITVLTMATGFTLLALSTGAVRRARARLRAGAQLRWWYFAAPINIPIWLLVTTTAAPKLGIAILTVALVCGQSLGGLVIDRIGLSSAGRAHMTPARLLGVGIAVSAVLIGALGSDGEVHVGLLALSVLTGSLWGLQQSAIGHVRAQLGEPFVAGMINSLIGATLVTTITLAIKGVAVPAGEEAMPFLCVLAGMIGIGVVFSVTQIVGRLGVLRLMLLIVAGQALGALLLDIVAPPEGETITATTVLSLALLFAAVIVSSRSQMRRAQPVASAA